VLLDYIAFLYYVSAKSSDRRLALKIAFILSFLYLIIFVGFGSTMPNYDPLAPGPLTAELMFGGFFMTAGFLVYIFASKKTMWKMTKSAGIGRYGRLLYLAMTSIIFITYGFILLVFVNGFFSSTEEKDRQNLLTGLALVATLFGAMIFLYLKHVFLKARGIPSRYQRHPPFFILHQTIFPDSAWHS